MQAGKLLPINFISAARHNPQFEPELEAKFRDNTLLPKLQAGIDGGFAGPPTETTIEKKTL